VIEHYPTIKLLHIVCVIVSGAVFALRGLLMLANRRALAANPALRYGSYAIDTLLLSAAVLLLVILQLNPLVQPWLALKLILLLVYIVLGSYALKRGRTRTLRMSCYLAALTVYLLMFGIARTHHPLGWLQVFSG